MARSLSQEASSLGRTGEANSSNCSHPIGYLLKCNHQTPVVYETCRKQRNYGRKFFGCRLWKLNQGCGFFVWEDELDKYLFEKSTRLEERVEHLIEEMSRLRNGNTANVELHEELNKLRGKLLKEKKKRKATEEELTALRDELCTLKHGGVLKKGWVKFVVFGVVLVVIAVKFVG